MMDPEFDVSMYMSGVNRLWYRLFGDLGMAAMSSAIVFVALRVLLYANLPWWQEALVFVAGIGFSLYAYVFAVRYYKRHNRSI